MDRRATRRAPARCKRLPVFFLERRLRHPMKHQLRSLPRSCLFALLIAGSIHAAEYDLIVRGGRIVDGTGNPWFQGDVAIKGDRIMAIGRVTGEAKRVINASNLVVTPGFIDMHSHSDWVLFEDGHAQSKIRQGVTGFSSARSRASARSTFEKHYRRN
jgi:hypothetical protein